MAGLYVHIPFCKSRCYYCDFYSTTLGQQVIKRYVGTVLAEAQLRVHELHTQPITLYLGGGTPSLMPIPLLQQLVNGLNEALQCKMFDVNGVREATIEVNPDDVTPDSARAWRCIGFNRISMGVQSLVDSELQAIGRRHSVIQVINAVSTLRAAGFDNISLDLIYGLPGQTIDSWRSSLEGVIALRPQHISAYCLSYEPGTLLWQRLESGDLNEASDETCEAMYNILLDVTDNIGYKHYEISNFALPGYYARHNSSYWDNTPYLGLGAAAHSYDGTSRRHINPANIFEYQREILHKGVVAGEDDILGTEQRYEEMVMLGLRTVRGINLRAMASILGNDYRQRLLDNAARHLADGLLRKVGDCLVLNRCALFRCDMIVRDLI